MSFLDEGTFIGKGAVKDALKDPEFKALKGDEKANALKTLKMGGSITTEDEEDNLDEDTADFLRKAGGAQYKTQFSDFAKKLKKRAIIMQAKKELEKKPPSGDPENPFEPRKFTVGLLRGGITYTVADDGIIKDSAGKVVGNVEDVEKNEKSSLSKELANIHKAPQDEFDAFIKNLGKEGYDKKAIDKLIKKQKEYQAKKVSDSAEKEKDTVKEGKLSRFLGGLALSAAALGAIGSINQSDKVLQDLKAKYEQADTKEEKKKIKDQISKRILFLDTGKSDSSTPMNEEDIKLPSDTTFTLDLKHLVKKHMNKGNDKESAIKFTKALMKKLHNKGEVEVDGTKVMFKEMKMDQDIPLALPEPDAPDFLGDDGMDYEGGMAKSQMLKMKKYVDALSNMIEDESQLESWVQAKLTKASDYMSAVYHYLDYQKSKMNELNEDEGQNIADFLNANYKEIASKLGNPGSNFEIIGDNKVATAGDGNEGIDISFDKNHMDKLFPKDDPYNEVKELTIAGKVVYYNDYRGSKMNELNEAKMSVNVNREDDEVEVTYKGERYKSALGDKLVFIHYFKDGEYHGENDAPKTFKYLKGKGGKLEVDDEEATLTINMSNLK